MSSQNQQLQMKGQQISQQARQQMQQAPQGSPVPMTTTQQSPQHQLQQSVQSPSQQQQQQQPTQTSIQQQPPLQPPPQQPLLSPQIQPNIAAGTAVGAGRGVAAVRGGAKKKTTATRKASTGGGRAKATPFEKSNSEDTKLPQMLNQMANDYYNQAQKLGFDTVEGSIMYKKYEEAMSAIQQINLNNQTATGYGLSMTQDHSQTSTSSPNTVNRPIAVTSIQQQQQLQNRQPIIPPRTLILPEYSNIHNYPQLMAEINRVQEALSQPNIAPNVKQECESRLNILRAMKQQQQQQQQQQQHMPSQQSFMSSQVARPTVQSSINTAGNDLNRMNSSQIQSPILPSTSMTTAQLQDMTSMTSTPNMHHQLGQRVMPPPQSPLTQQQQLQQHPSQSVGSNEMMDIDVESSAQKTAELLATSSVATAPRQVAPIAPAINTNILSSTLINNQTGKIPIGHAGKAPIFSNNASFTEAPASVAMDIDTDDRHLLPKRKVQQLVDQIDPKERLEPEVEEMLLEIADEFISSVASFACLLAKHRKSDTLEVKDLQLHLERNWNIRIPGFASDEIRSVRKPVVSTSHQQKLAAVMQAKTNKIASVTGQSN